MANTSFLAANRLTEQVWPETAFAYMLENMQLSKFMGSDSNSIIQINKDLSVKPGSKVTCRLRSPLSGAGGYDDSDIEGNEEAMSFFNFPVEVHERSHGVRSAGKMTEQYTKIDIIREATEALMGDWAPDQVENDLIYALCGLGNQGGYVGEASDIDTVNEHAPSSNRRLFGGQTIAGVEDWVADINHIGDAGSTDYKNYLFGTKVIEKAMIKAKLSAPKFRPVKVAGKGYYVMFLHPLAVMDLYKDTNWNATQQAANVRGLVNPMFTRGKDGPRVDEKNRMFDGAIGVWKDVILFELDRMPYGVADNVFYSNAGADTVDTNIVDGTSRVVQSILCGAQAGMLAWAQTWKKYQKDFDYDRKPGVATDGIYGASKTVFNDPGAGQSTNTAQDDFAVISVFTAATEV